MLSRALAWGSVLETDYTLYDLSMRTFARRMEMAFVRAICPQEEVEDFNKCLELMLRARILHVDGITAKAVVGRYSGERGTSIFNALYQGFRIYVTACREGIPFDQFRFFCEGDDGLDGLSPPPAVARDAELLGLDVKVKHYPSIYQATFLSRCHGRLGPQALVSMADVSRALRKYHLSARPPGVVGNSGLLAAKSLAYLATDYHTPLLGAVAWACFHRNQHHLTPVALTIHRHRYESGGYNASIIARWPAPPIIPTLVATVALNTGLSPEVIVMWHHWWIGWGKDNKLSQPPPVALPLGGSDASFVAV